MLIAFPGILPTEQKSQDDNDDGDADCLSIFHFENRRDVPTLSCIASAAIHPMGWLYLECQCRATTNTYLARNSMNQYDACATTTTC